jgi:hypothetical protein
MPPDKVFKVGDWVAGRGYKGQIIQIPGRDEYVIIDEQGGKRIDESRFLEAMPPGYQPKSAKNVKLK